MSYKHNQIEEAIARIFDPNCQEPPSGLRTRIKRLLELNRSIGRKLRSKDSEEANFGFSPRRHLAPEPIFRSRNMKPLHC
jgi:hypothetical protein